MTLNIYFSISLFTKKIPNSYLEVIPETDDLKGSIFLVVLRDSA